MKISIIIPVFNKEKYLKKSLDSVIYQTFKDIEIICINDCSTDKSLDILNEYAKKDNRVKIISHSANMGQGVSRNLGINMSKGEFLMFLDPDDWLEADACEKAYNQIISGDYDYVYFGFYFYKEKKQKRKIDTSRLKPFVSKPSVTDYFELDGPFMQYGECWNKIYKKEFLINNDIKFLETRFAEDIPFYIKCIINAKRFSVLNEPLYNYRIYSESTNLNSLNYLELLQAREAGYRIVLETNNPVFNKYYISAYINSLLGWYIRWGQRNLRFLKQKHEYYNIMRKIFISLQNQVLKYGIKEELTHYERFKDIIKFNYFQFNILYGLKRIFSVQKIDQTIYLYLLGIKIKLFKDLTPYKVDIVYTWVDNHDPEWKNKKKQYEQTQEIEPEANPNCRYNNNDELKYSLRSIEKYAPWLNHVYIITDNQCPEWLNTENPRVTIINHKDIIPNDALPTYNSIAIEYCMHKIPNLSEYFIYANDDTFMGDFIDKNFFYTNQGKPICRFGKEVSKLEDTSLYKKVIYNSINLLKSKSYNFRQKTPNHNIDAYRKSIIEDCQKEFPEEFKRTVYSRFRNSNNMERIIYSYYAVANDKGKYKKIWRYNLSKSVIIKYLKAIFKGTPNDSMYINCHCEDINANYLRYKTKLFCMNDTTNTTDTDRINARKYLEFRFPEKSSFEK